MPVGQLTVHLAASRAVTWPLPVVTDLALELPPLARGAVDY